MRSTCITMTTVFFSQGLKQLGQLVGLLNDHCRVRIMYEKNKITSVNVFNAKNLHVNMVMADGRLGTTIGKK